MTARQMQDSCRLVLDVSDLLADFRLVAIWTDAVSLPYFTGLL
jgi:hypothetical protein